MLVVGCWEWCAARLGLNGEVPLPFLHLALVSPLAVHVNFSWCRNCFLVHLFNMSTIEHPAHRQHLLVCELDIQRDMPTPVAAIQGVSRETSLPLPNHFSLNRPPGGQFVVVDTVAVVIDTVAPPTHLGLNEGLEEGVRFSNAVSLQKLETSSSAKMAMIPLGGRPS